MVIFAREVACIHGDEEDPPQTTDTTKKHPGSTVERWWESTGFGPLHRASLLI